MLEPLGEVLVPPLPELWRAWLITSHSPVCDKRKNKLISPNNVATAPQTSQAPGRKLTGCSGEASTTEECTLTPATEELSKTMSH